MRFINDNPNINFVGFGNLGMVCSVMLITISALVIAFCGLNLGIDFVGGELIEFRCLEQHADKRPGIVELRKTTQDVIENGSIYKTEGGDFILKSRSAKHGGSRIDSIKGAIEKTFGPGNVEYRRVDYVGSQVSKSMLIKGGIAIFAALFGVMLYLYARFNAYFAMSGVVTLLHDIGLLFGFYAITRLEFDLSSIAAILTIIGYSINDSVVIYDSIRDQSALHPDRDIKTTINICLNKTLSRTIFTSLTTAIAAGVLVIASGDVIRPFSWAILFGIIVGTYSSIVVSSQFLILTKNIGLAGSQIVTRDS